MSYSFLSRHSRAKRRAGVGRIVLILAALLGVSTVALRLTQTELAWAPGVEVAAALGGEPRSLRLPTFVGAGHWVPPSELGWQDATSGWQAISLAGLPKIDASFLGTELSIAGDTYEDGIGTYPFSEISYDAHGAYALVRAKVGVDDRSPSGAAAVFQVVADQETVYRSPPIARGQEARELIVPISGAQNVRLIVTRPPGAERGGYANWADLSFFEPLVAVGEAPPQPVSPLLQQAAKRPRTGAAELDFLANLAQTEARYVAERTGGQAIAGVSDRGRRRHVLANSELAIIYDAAQPQSNTFTVLDRRHSRILMHAVSVDVTLDGGREIALARDAVINIDRIGFVEADQKALGSGRSLVVRLRAGADGLVMTLRFTLFPGSQYFLVEADVPGAAPSSEILYTFFARDAGPGFVVGTRPQILSDLTRLRQTRVHDDGLPRELAFDLGKPVILWGDEIPGAILMTTLDETRRIPVLAVSRPTDSVRASLSVTASNADRGSASPRLYVEATPTADLREVASNYKRLLDAAYPEPPLPDWVRFQWSTWYPFEMNISHDVVARQLDLISQHFADLGPWHMVLDAGWYVAEGRPGSDLRATDRAKFPRGIRALVDYAHGKGIKLLMYTTTPYLDQRQKAGNWAGLRDVIERHPEWLIPLGRRAEPAFAFNYEHPGLRAYMYELLRDMFQDYDADGLLIDGLGSVEEGLVARRFLDARGLVSVVVDQTMEIYRLIWEGSARLKEGLFIEGGLAQPRVRPAVRAHLPPGG